MSTQNPNESPEIPGGNGNLNEKMKAFIERNLENKFGEKVDERTPVNAKIFDKIAEYAKNNAEIRDEIDSEIRTLLFADFRRVHPNASEEEFANIFEAQKSKILDFALKILSNRQIATENHRKIIDTFFDRQIFGNFSFLEKNKQLSIFEMNRDFSDAKNIIDFYKNRGVDIKKFRKKSQKLEEIIEKFYTSEDDFHTNLSDEEFDELNEEFAKFHKNGITSEELIGLLMLAQGRNAEPEKIAKLCMALSPTLAYSSIKKHILTTQLSQTNFEKRIFEDFLSDHNIELNEDFEEKFLEFRAHFNHQNYDFLLEDFQEYFDNSENFYGKIKKMLLNDNNFRSDIAEKFLNLNQDISEEQESAENKNFAEIFQEKLTKKIEELDENHKEKMGNDWRKNLKKVIVDNYLCLIAEEGKVGNWQILEFEEKEDHGESDIFVTLLKQEVERFPDGDLYWGGSSEYRYSLDEFVDFFVENLKKSEISEAYFSEDLEEPDEEIEDIDENQETNNELNTLADLTARLDEIDPDNATKGFSAGMTFCVMAKKWPEYVKVRSIDESQKSLVIELCDGKTIPSKEDPSPFFWQDFLELINNSKNFFRRLGNVETPENFVENASFLPKNSSEKLEKIPGIEFKDNQISISETIDGQIKSTKLYGFKDEEKGTMIEMKKFANGEIQAEITLFASLKEMDPETAKKKEEWLEGEKKKKVKAGNLVKKKRVIKKGGLTTTQFLQILEKYNAKTPVGENEGKDFVKEQEEKNKLSQGDYLEKKSLGMSGGVLTLGQIYYIAKSGKEYFEKYMKEKADMQTAYALINSNIDFANRMGVQAMGKVIDGKVDTVKSKYMGVERRRWLADNILKDGAKPKPHEVFAGLMLVYDMSGTLYPDTDLQQFQWTKYRWFELVCNALDLDSKREFALCYDKEAANRVGSREHIPEEELIKRLFKSHQGDKLMVQAVGGGAKIWKMAEAGKSAQKSKGEKEVKEEASEGPGRAQYMIAKFGSNEFEVALGAFPQLMAKTTSPEQMGVMFSYVMGGAPNYVHYSTGIDFKNYIWKGVAFNALVFSEKKSDADLYKKVVETAINYRVKKNMPGAKDMQDAYNEIKKKMPNDPFQHVDAGKKPGEKSKDADRYKDLFAFWQKYHKVLHPIMQGTDPLLQTAYMDESELLDSSEKEYIHNYFDKLSDYGHNMLWLEGGFKRNAGDNMSGTVGTLNVNSSMMYFGRKESLMYRSLSGYLGEISFDGTTGSLSGGDRDNIFFPKVVDFLNVIRDNTSFKNNPNYQRKQFEMSFSEIWGKVAGKIMWAKPKQEKYEEMLASADGYKYLHRLKKEYKFDISWESLKAFSLEGKDEDTSEAKTKRQEVLDKVYNSFILGNSVPQTTDSTRNRVYDTLDFSSNDAAYRKQA